MSRPGAPSPGNPAEGLGDPAEGLGDPAEGLGDPAEGLAGTLWVPLGVTRRHDGVL
jgi:hypothetical protein